jgi:hypothetical protein
MTPEETVIQRYEGYLRDGFMQTEDNQGNISREPITQDIELNLKKQIVRMKELMEYKAIARTMSPRDARDWRLNQKINSSEAEEALSWFEQSKRHRVDGGMGSFDLRAIQGKRAIRLVKELYDLGAVRVVAIEIDRFDGRTEHQNTDSLVVEVPDEPISRQKLFEKIVKIGRSQLYAPTLDEGQKYVLLRWD